MSENHQCGRVQGEARRHLLRLLRAERSRGESGAPAVPTWSLSDEGEDELVRAMMRHRVAAMLHPLLDAQPNLDALPVELLGLCRQVYFTILRRNAVTLDVGEALLTGFAREGIDAVPRGAWDWMRGHTPIYADPGQRPIDGLFVSVPAPELGRSRDLARGMGFREAVGQPGGDAVLWRRVGRLRLSLQFGSEEPPPRPQRRLIDAVSGLARVRFARWLGLVDVHRMVESQPLGWGPLRREARARGLERDLIGAFRLARELLGTPIPEGVLPLRRVARGERSRGLQGLAQGG